MVLREKRRKTIFVGSKAARGGDRSAWRCFAGGDAEGGIALGVVVGNLGVVSGDVELVPGWTDEGDLWKNINLVHMPLKRYNNRTITVGCSNGFVENVLFETMNIYSVFCP
ncbi:hypothetical protein RYX36_013718 [Vicia faba]